MQTVRKNSITRTGIKLLIVELLAVMLALSTACSGNTVKETDDTQLSTKVLDRSDADEAYETDTTFGTNIIREE